MPQGNMFVSLVKFTLFTIAVKITFLFSRKLLNVAKYTVPKTLYKLHSFSENSKSVQEKTLHKLKNVLNFEHRQFENLNFQH